MSNDLGAAKNNNTDNLLDSGVDFSSLGSSESECDPEKYHSIDDQSGKNEFFKGKTPEISDKVLHTSKFNKFPSDESDPNLFDHNSQSQKPNESKESDFPSPKINKAKSYGSENTSPQIIQAKQQLEKLMRQLETKSAQKSAELEKVNQQLLSHSAELNKYNQEIEAKLSELKKAQSQLHKFVGESGDHTPIGSPSSIQSPISDNKNNSNILSPMSVIQNRDDSTPNKQDGIQSPIIDNQNQGNFQTRDIVISPSPRKDEDSFTDKIQPGSPQFNNLNNQLEQANMQLEKLQNQLNQFLNVFDPNDKDKSGMNDDEISKLIEKAKEDKKLADSVKSTFPNITPGDIQARTVELKPNLPQLEKLQNQLHQFCDIFSPDSHQNKNENLSDEEFENIINQAKAIKDLSESIESLFPPQDNSNFFSPNPSHSINPNDLTLQINNLKSKAAEFDKVLDQLKKVSQQLDAKSSELEDAQNQLRNTNQELDSKSNELEDTQNQLIKANQQIDSKEADLNEVNQKLGDLYQIIEAIEGEKISPENLTNERLSSILEKIKNQNYEGKNSQNYDPSQDAVNQSRLKEIADIYDKQGNLSEEEFAQMIDMAKKNKELSEVIQSSLPANSSNPNEVQQKIKDLEAQSAELEKIRQQFNSIVSAVEGNNENTSDKDNTEMSDEKLSEIIEKARRGIEISNALQSSAPNEVQEKLRDLESKSAELQKVKQKFNSVIQAIGGNDEIINDDSNEIPDEKLSEIIEKARKDKEISETLQSSPTIDSLNPNEVQDKIRDLESRSAELEKVKQQFNSVIQAIGGSNGNNDNCDDISDEKISEIIEKAKKDKQISNLVQSSLTDDALPSKEKEDDNEAVERRIDTLKKRSDQLDEVTTQLAKKTAELESVRKQITKLIDIINSNNENSKTRQYNNETVNQIIEKAERSRQPQQLSEEEIETREVQLDVDEQIGIQRYGTQNQPYSQTQRQLDQFLSIFGEENNNNNDMEELDTNGIDNIIKNAKRDKELSEAVKTSLPNHSSCGEEVQAAINILKLRSSELDDRIPASEAAQLRKRLEFLRNTVACLTQPKGPAIDTVEAEQNSDQNLGKNDE